MRDNLGMRWVMRWIAVLCVALLPQLAWAADAGGAKEQAQRQSSQPGNNAPFWGDVRGGENPYQTTQVQGIESNILVQSGGETWRQIRNGPITVYGGWLLVVITLLIGVYYGVKGQIKLHDKPTGRLMQRFSPWDRVMHWSTAISFVILATTGMITLFGKYILLPVFGYTLFSWLAILSKNLHNFVGPLFAVCIVLLFFTFVKDNIPKAHDWLWMRKAGGLLSGEHVPSDRFNAGEKIWFWFGVTLLGIVASVTGFILDFSNFGQGRLLMQQANVIHGIAAVLFVPMALAHIYIGTLGVEGAYDSMRTGSVDETWAKEHHENWYNDAKARQRHAPGGAPSAAVASAMKEGWK